MQVAAHSLGVIMRRLFQLGTPRGLQGRCALFFVALRWQIGAFVSSLRPLAVSSSVDVTGHRYALAH